MTTDIGFAALAFALAILAFYNLATAKRAWRIGKITGKYGISYQQQDNAMTFWALVVRLLIGCVVSGSLAVLFGLSAADGLIG